VSPCLRRSLDAPEEENEGGATVVSGRTGAEAPLHADVGPSDPSGVCW